MRVSSRNEQREAPGETHAIELSGEIQAGSKSLPIAMRLMRSEGKIEGIYWYEKHKKSISLWGEVTNGNRVNLIERNPEGQLTGEFMGQLNENSFKGTWSSPDRKKNFPFSLRGSHGVNIPPLDDDGTVCLKAVKTVFIRSSPYTVNQDGTAKRDNITSKLNVGDGLCGAGYYDGPHNGSCVQWAVYSDEGITDYFCVALPDSQLMVKPKD